MQDPDGIRKTLAVTADGNGQYTVKFTPKFGGQYRLVSWMFNAYTQTACTTYDSVFDEDIRDCIDTRVPSFAIVNVATKPSVPRMATVTTDASVDAGTETTVSIQSKTEDGDDNDVGTDRYTVKVYKETLSPGSRRLLFTSTAGSAPEDLTVTYTSGGVYEAKYTPSTPGRYFIEVKMENEFTDNTAYVTS